MKTLLTGTIHVGKTTLVEAVREAQLPGIIVIPEVARELLSEFPELEMDPNLQDILFSEQVRREKLAESTANIVICDRGSLDIIAHSKMFGHTVKPEWAEWIKTYDAIFLLNKEDVSFDGENRAVSDSTRDWNAFRDNLDTHIKSTLIEYGCHFELLSGNPESRFGRFSHYLEGQYKNSEGQTLSENGYQEGYSRGVERF